MGLIGRDAEVKAVTAAVNAVQSGREACLLILGDAGIGKSRLAAEVAELAAGRGMAMLSGRASPSASAPPLWPWFQALSGRSERALLPSAADDGLAGEGLRRRWESFERVASALAAASVGSGTAIVLEDMHWADESSLELVAACAGTAGVLLVITFRDEDVQAPLGTAIAAAQARPGTVRLALLAWTAAEVATAAGDVDPTWAPLLYDGSGGNPLIVAEMVSSLVDAGLASTTAPDAWPLRVPARVADITAQRLRRLPQTARAVVFASSVFGQPASPMQIADLADLDPTEVHEAIDVGVAARLLALVGDEPARVAPTHDLVREAAYALLDMRTRLALHRRAADLIEAGRLDGDLVAHRLRCIIDNTDRDRALQACRTAAEEASNRLGFDRAVAVLDAALTLPGLTPSVRTVLLLDAATSEYRRGALHAAVARCEEASASSNDPDLLARAALVVRGVSGPVNGGIIPLCDRALGAVPADATGLRSQLLAQKALATSEVLGPVEADTISAQALALAESSGDEQALLLALHARHQAMTSPAYVHDRVALAERLIDLAGAAGDPTTELWGRIARIDAAFELGQPAVLHSSIARLQGLADRLGWPLASWHAHRLRAAIALLRGDFRGADAQTQLAYADAARTREPLYTALLGLLDFQRREQLGDLAAAADAVRSFAAGLGETPIAWSNGGALLLAAGERDAAHDCYERLRPVLRQLPIDGRWFFTVLGSAELAMAFEDTDTAGWCYRTLLPYGDLFQAGAGGTMFCRGSVSRLLGHLAEAAGDLDAAEGHLSVAIAAEDRIGAVPFAAISRLGLAAVLLGRGRAADLVSARELVSAAAGTARRLGMPLAVATAAELSRQVRATPSVSFTDRERQVLALLAGGASNRSIAATLVVSERTAEYHVANLLTKIGAANRTEAAAWALRHDYDKSP